MENRDLTEGLTRPEEVENLFLAGRGHLKDLHPSGDHHIEADPWIALKKNRDTLAVLPGETDGGDFPELFRGQSAEQQAVCQQCILVVHYYFRKMEFLTYVKEAFP